MEQEGEKLYCPNCGSTQLTANKKGFSAGKAFGGAILTGGIGLLAGFHGSGKVKVTCLKCGKKTNAGKLSTTPLPPPKKQEEDVTWDNSSTIGCIAIIIIGISILALFMWAF